MKKVLSVLALVTLIAVLGGCSLGFEVNTDKTPADDGSAVTATDETVAAGQVFKNERFSYVCPEGWTLGTNKNYDGQVTLSECSKIYSGTVSFDDGVDVSFGFVPTSVFNDVSFNEVKNESNAVAYLNNSFNGWISMKNAKHTLKMIARLPVPGQDGFYEVIADAEGSTKTDSEFKAMIDEIVSSFVLIGARPE